MLLSFGAMLVLSRWITKHVQGIGYLLTQDGQIALILYFLIILPGVLLHEFSHALMALLLGVRVRRLSIGLRRKAGGRQVALGSVDIAATDPIRASLIGVAPLVTGCTTILIVCGRILHIGLLPPLGTSGFWQALKRIYAIPDFWLWMYLILAVGNAMLPSAADRQSWGPAIVFVAFLGAAFYFSGLLDSASTTLSTWASSGASQLAYAFGVTAVVDVVFIALLLLFEQLLAMFGLGRIQYR
jgi:hypothetical protein